jgi:hypothetical protein
MSIIVQGLYAVTKGVSVGNPDFFRWGYFLLMYYIALDALLHGAQKELMEPFLGEEDKQR